MLNLTQKGVEIFIRRAKNIEPFWQNYDLVIWKKDPSGYTSMNGMFRNETWGIAERIPIDNQGLWKLNSKYVRYFR